MRCPRGKSVNGFRGGKRGLLSFLPRSFRQSVSSGEHFSRFVVLCLILLGIFLRWPLWTSFRLREDEALYAHWAWLIYSHIDPMLRTSPVDKPPLFPYLMARTFDLLGPLEVSVRWPNMVAGALTLPLLYTWSRYYYAPSVARRSLFIYAVLPLPILLTPTGYMDTFMLAGTLVAAVLAARARRCRDGKRAHGFAFLSGLAFSAAVATKPFALLWLPLVVWEVRGRHRGTWILGALYPLWRWAAWEWARGKPFTLSTAVKHYGGVALVPPAAWPSRVREWMGVFSTSVGTPLVWLLALWGSVRGWKEPKRRGLPLLAGWFGGVALLYLISDLRPWDRYVLVMMPIIAVWAALGWEQVDAWTRTQSFWGGRAVHVMVAGLLLWVGTRGGMAQYPVGGDHGAYDGIDAVSAYIMSVLPKGGVVYHHWLGWHYGFYLFAAPYDYRWWPNPSWLARDAAQPDGIARVLVFPAWHERERQEVFNALRAAGVHISPRVRVYGRDGTLRFYVYTLSTGPSRQTSQPSRAQEPQMPMPHRMTRAQESCAGTR